MIKRLLAASIYFSSLSAFACTVASPTDDANFCTSFKVAATCYCTSSGIPSGMCQDMKKLYSRMLAVFGSLQRACQYQADKLHYTTTQDCIDNWSCYINGGIDSRGRLCNGGTQQPCPQ